MHFSTTPALAVATAAIEHEGRLHVDFGGTGLGAAAWVEATMSLAGTVEVTVSWQSGSVAPNMAAQHLADVAAALAFANDLQAALAAEAAAK